MNKYILLYGDKKPEDIICIKNMFENTRQINLGWVEHDYTIDMKIIEEEINSNKVEQVIFFGLEINWFKLIETIKEKYTNVKVKVICNTSDALLYYDYERENFFKLLELSKANKIDEVGFLKKGQYEVYKTLGYKCSYIMQNYILEDSKKAKIKEKNDKTDIGVYPLCYLWDKNIFNQLTIGKFIDNSIVNYNMLDERMEDFLNTMRIENKPVKVEVNEDSLINEIIKNDVIVNCSFTEYFQPVFFISMELGVPCVIGDNTDLFAEAKELEKLVVTTEEDNPMKNYKIVEKTIENKEKIMKLYKEWKETYNKKAKDSLNEFLEK